MTSRLGTGKSLALFYSAFLLLSVLAVLRQHLIIPFNYNDSCLDVSIIMSLLCSESMVAVLAVSRLLSSFFHGSPPKDVTDPFLTVSCLFF